MENLNQRAFPTTCSTCSATQEGVAPDLKPYRQHEALSGIDYQVSRNVAFEVRYDRRRLDHVIEDAAVYNPAIGETFVVVNPGQGVNATFSGYCNFLYGYGAPVALHQGGQYPGKKQFPAARSYDGVEFRATKALSNHWYGLFSYTYSHFRGNYTGLTSSDMLMVEAAAVILRTTAAPSMNPTSSTTRLAVLPAACCRLTVPTLSRRYAYYQFDFLQKFTTNFGLFQTSIRALRTRPMPTWAIARTRSR